MERAIEKVKDAASSPVALQLQDPPHSEAMPNGVQLTGEQALGAHVLIFLISKNFCIKKIRKKSKIITLPMKVKMKVCLSWVIYVCQTHNQLRAAEDRKNKVRGRNSAFPWYARQPEIIWSIKETQRKSNRCRLDLWVRDLRGNLRVPQCDADEIMYFHAHLALNYSVKAEIFSGKRTFDLA